MLYSYFAMNFVTLMILLALGAMMFVNRDVRIPSTNVVAKPWMGPEPKTNRMIPVRSVVT